ncbi:uncharacterized protein GJ701_002515 [Geothlypis trichas]
MASLQSVKSIRTGRARPVNMQKVASGMVLQGGTQSGLMPTAVWTDDKKAVWFWQEEKCTLKKTYQKATNLIFVASPVNTQIAVIKPHIFNGTSAISSCPNDAKAALQRGHLYRKMRSPQRDDTTSKPGKKDTAQVERDVDS